MHEDRSDIRGTGSYLINALKNQPSYFVQSINLERRRRGLPEIPVSGKPWEQLTAAEKRNVQHGVTQDRLEDARQEARLLELQQELARLKAVVGRES